jgi:hypothetical protein
MNLDEIGTSFKDVVRLNDEIESNKPSIGKTSKQKDTDSIGSLRNEDIRYCMSLGQLQLLRKDSFTESEIRNAKVRLLRQFYENNHSSDTADVFTQNVDSAYDYVCSYLRERGKLKDE